MTPFQDSYTVMRSTSGAVGSYARIATTTSTGFTDMNLTSGKTYYYVVSASNSAGSSGNSNQASATAR